MADFPVVTADLVRGAIGVAFAILIAWTARRYRALSPDGAVTAAIAGTVCAIAGWSWAGILIAFFASGTLLSRFGQQRKSAVTAGLVEKGGERDAFQVLANGGVFCTCAALSWTTGSPAWMAAGAGAIATSTADTWATEIGTLYGREPRSILGFHRVPPGTSGGISFAGTVAAIVGALFIALVASVAGWPRWAAWAALAGGVAGCMLDSILGASLQARRWCATCRADTESAVHICGNTTAHRGGVRWMNNDAVNALSSLGGAAIAALFV